MKRFLKTLICLMFFIEQAFCGGNWTKDTLTGKKFSLISNFNFGISWFSTHPGIPEQMNVRTNRFSPDISMRVLWQPEYRLSVGLESGWTRMYSYKIVDPDLDGRVAVTAIPILVEFSMPVTHSFRIYAGAGTFFETTHLEFEGKMKSSSFSLGWMAAGSYTIMLKSRYSVSAEIKWLDAAASEHAVLCAQLQFAWNLIQW